MTDAELREQVHELRTMHVHFKVIEILKLMLDRIEAIENHLHDKFGERP